MRAFAWLVVLGLVRVAESSHTYGKPKPSLPYFYGNMAYNTNIYNKPYGSMTYGKKYGHKTYGMLYLPVYIQPPQDIPSDECAGQFVCADGGEYGKAVCLAASRVCDGHSDCGNGADEQGCGLTADYCHSKGMILCSDRKRCGRLCDGKRDCHDGEDEELCPSTCHCGPGLYRCSDGETCISPAKVCDGSPDCPHGKDETNCSPVCMCGEGRYLCEDSDLCLDRTKVCDGTEDCPNGDDETYCPPGCKCQPTQYLCVGGTKCIDQEQLCETAPPATPAPATPAPPPIDCPFGDDEECGF